LLLEECEELLDRSETSVDVATGGDDPLGVRCDLWWGDVVDVALPSKGAPEAIQLLLRVNRDRLFGGRQVIGEGVRHGDGQE
jgi:hypothetical protein